MKILIIGPAWVGDMVMAQSLFMRLRELHPGAIIDVLAPAWTQPLLERMPEVRQALEMPLGHGHLGLGIRRALGQGLRSEGYERAIVLPNSLKSALIPWFAEIPRRSGWLGEFRYILLNDVRKLDKHRYPLMVQRFVALAQAPGQLVGDDYPRPALQVDQQRAATLMAQFSLDPGKPALALCPGAEFGPSKQWPSEYFAAVAAAALKQGQQVWLLGSARDREVAQEISSCEVLEGAGELYDFTGETTLADAIDLLSQAAAVVSNDSGLMHVAAALQRPLVVLYGSTSPVFTPPLSERVEMLSQGLDCSPCFKRTCPLQHHRCMRDMKPESVIQALSRLGMQMHARSAGSL